MVAGVHHHRVGDEQEIELAALGDARDLLDDRELHVTGRRALPAPSSRVIAGAEDEHPEMHLPLRRTHSATFRKYRRGETLSQHRVYCSRWITASVPSPRARPACRGVPARP